MIVRFVSKFALAAAICIFFVAPAFAQCTYNCGTTTTGTNGTYTAPKGGYSSATGIGIGAGVAAGVAVAYLAFHKASVVGCVQPSSDGLKLMNEKDKKTYAIDANGEDVKSGEKVQLKGKKVKDTAGHESFVVKSVKSMGPCA